jgi:hypothetical protein
MMGKGKVGIKVVNQLAIDRWREFVANHPNGNAYHTPEMFDAYSGADGYQPHLWAVTDDDRILALFLPVQITLAGGPARYLTSRDVVFGGALVAPGPDGRRALNLLLEAYNAGHGGVPLFTEIRNCADQRGIQDILERHGYRYEGHLNYLLDLDREESDILQGFSKSARNRVRKCLRGEEYRVEEVIDRDMIPTLYGLFRETYRHANVPLADISLFQAAFDVLVPRNMAYFSIASAAGVPVAGQVAIRHNDVAIGWYNGVDRSSEWSCNEFLIWDVIRWSHRVGCRTFDFGGAGKPGEKTGVREFKSKFRGELVNFGRNTRVHFAMRMKISRWGYQLARRSRGILGKLGDDIGLAARSTSVPTADHE